MDAGLEQRVKRNIQQTTSLLSLTPFLDIRYAYEVSYFMRTKDLLKCDAPYMHTLGLTLKGSKKITFVLTEHYHYKASL